jgi:hypothetical protein
VILEEPPTAHAITSGDAKEEKWSKKDFQSRHVNTVHHF